MAKHFHIVNFSGGVTSWVAAKRVVERYGSEGVTLITADTGGEAEDWHEFVRAAAEDVGAEEHVWVRSEKYKDIYDLATQVRFLPSSYAGACSIKLKVEPIAKWLKENAAEGFVQHFGFDWSEMHRLDKLRTNNPDRDPERIQAPLVWEPMIGKSECMEMLEQSGLPMPEGYKQGFPHNNCLATGCFKQSPKGWAHLLKHRPEAYARTEKYEQWFRENISEGAAIHRADYSEKKMGKRAGKTLTELRVVAERNIPLPFVDDGPCSCFSPDELDALVVD